MKLLLEAGTNVNLQNKDSNTAFMVARMNLLLDFNSANINSYYECMNLLLQTGSNIHDKAMADNAKSTK